MTTCLLLIDTVNDYLDRFSRSTRERLIAAINELSAAFRAASLPVVWVRQEFEADLSDAFPEMRSKGIAITVRGTFGAELHADLDRGSSDSVVIKKRYSAFFGTNLDALFAKFDVDTVVLGGVNTHACIRMAAIDAYQRDLSVVIATDAVASHDERHAEVSLDYMRDRIAALMTNGKILTSLASIS